MAWYEKTSSPHLPYLTFGFLALGEFSWAVAHRANSYRSLLIAALLGLFFWTGLEYFIHRVLLHVPLGEGRWDYLSRLTHWRHHEDPQDPELVALPLGVGLPIYFIFCLLAYLVIREQHETLAWCSGLAFGYAAYEAIHFAIHFYKGRLPIFLWLKAHHFHHHFQNSFACFGISSPLWDKILGTGGKRRKSKRPD